MAFENEGSLKGSEKKYRLNPEVKRYTLRDHGFTETKSGNFQLIRSLDTVAGSKQGVMLKVTVMKDLSSFKMSTTTANGLKFVNVYGNKGMQSLRDNLEYILEGLVSEKILQEI